MKAILSIMRFVFSTIKAICLIVFFLLLLSVLLICFREVAESLETGSPSISHIETIEYRDGTNDKYYGIKYFAETDSCFRFLFDSVKEMEEGPITIVTNAKAISFYHGAPDYSYFRNTEAFFFRRFSFGFKFVTLRPTRILKKAAFIKEKLPTKTTFKGDFNELSIDVLQSFIGDASEDELNKEKLVHTYELYNRDGIRKVVIDYHENGKWFDIEVL